MNTRLAYTLSLVFWIALITLTVLWEGWLAPTPPPGLWLTIKSLLLLVPLFGMLHMKRTSFSIAGLIAMLYFTEGVMISWGELATGSQNTVLLALSLAEVFLVLGFVVCIYIYLRNTKRRGENQEER
ncbi:hypothetical protein BMS3Bbin11_01440 [bacterium BMS3Bbin11]|nr:hypothetical protein BMS3Abin11_02037 [bacterium BMS3Abin11]GBE46340.1 hypothetical protein BMS3Bbin11_01440 [bacterium BMS3Bbin11]GMT39382.1 MAG: hypothetical protein IEMM0001_0117 [bacterium]